MFCYGIHCAGQMDINDCGVSKTVAFSVAFEGIHQVAVKNKDKEDKFKT